MSSKFSTSAAITIVSLWAAVGTVWAAGTPRTLEISNKEEPLFLPGAVKIQFKREVVAAGIEKFRKAYRITPVEPNFKYDAEALGRESSAAIRLWQRSAEPPVAQWLELIVPFGQEQRWVEIFANDPNLRSAERVKYESFLGSDPNVKPQERSATAGHFVLPVQGNTDAIFPKLRKFLDERYSQPAKVYDGGKEDESTSVRQVFHADYLNCEILPWGWQCLVLDAVLLQKDGKTYLDVTVDGRFAYGGTGWLSIPPELNNFEPLLPKYEGQVHQFAGQLKKLITAVL